MKGQLTMINLMVIFIILVVYIMGLMPVLQDVISEAVANNNALVPQPENIGLINTLLELIPFLILAMIVLTGFMYATPRREGVAAYGQF